MITPWRCGQRQWWLRSHRRDPVTRKRLPKFSPGAAAQTSTAAEPCCRRTISAIQTGAKGDVQFGGVG